MNFREIFGREKLYTSRAPIICNSTVSLTSDNRADARLLSVVDNTSDRVLVIVFVCQF